MTVIKILFLQFLTPFYRLKGVFDSFYLIIEPFFKQLKWPSWFSKTILIGFILVLIQKGFEFIWNLFFHLKESSRFKIFDPILESFPNISWTKTPAIMWGFTAFSIIFVIGLTRILFRILRFSVKTHPEAFNTVLSHHQETLFALREKQRLEKSLPKAKSHPTQKRL